MRDFRELKVWEKSHQLTLAVYKATAGFPKDELYGITSQRLGFKSRFFATKTPSHEATPSGIDSTAN